MKKNGDMDTTVKKKALPTSRASLSPQRKDKCIVFPLVRYNELRQPVCQVCNVVMVEAIRAHLTSPEHIQIMENLKANTARSTVLNNAKHVNGTNLPKANPEQPQVTEGQLPECPQDVPKHQSPAMLPRDFCDDSGKIRTRSVSKVTEEMGLPKGPEHWESIDSTRMKSKDFPSTGEVLGSSKRGRPRKTKPTKFISNQTSNPSSTPRRSKRIKHVADKTAKNMPEVSSSEDVMKERAAENSQVDGKEVSSDIDFLVIYKRKRLPRKRASVSPPHQDPPAAAPANVDTPLVEYTNTAEQVLSKSLVEEAKKVNPAPDNSQEQVVYSKDQESPDQVDPKTDEVSNVNTPLDVEAINKMIEDDPLSAIENILTGKISISSKTPQSTSRLERPKGQSTSADVLAKELKYLIQTFSLGDFITDYEQMSKVLLILEELQKNEKSLSLAQQAFIKAFRLFIKKAVTHRKECYIAGVKKVELNRAKEDILLKLQETKNTQEQITTSIFNANNRVIEISSCIEQLEEQLSKLKEERETFQLAINEGEKQRETLKNDSIVWAHQAKDLVFDLAEIEAKVKILGEQHEADKDAYVQFRASFPF
ncbi:uncharacterized protein LOC109788283 isoform X2 [Cajanus cajan]|uniref:uncharacterized protein LOC109788283 isoform X2 n=1 Tax=Cajanus cajan TaxID=3821 RepID=UPI00098DAE7F|nr:uncharacterized protein LOC109788283 isoform X2 [Cajanus cajan]